ncbi:hypothetical protein RhiJN_25928 [Ceratobasidium sp. AG-Ba]|nr:hypothetical protein RhiJN_25928 [Ceratobasidium sp. AG-Ba]
MASKKTPSTSKHGRCSVEGVGWPAVTVEIEHISSSQPSKKAKPSKDKGRRRKFAPKTIEFEVENVPCEATQPFGDPTDPVGGLRPPDQPTEEGDRIFSNVQNDFDNKIYHQEEEKLNEISEKAERKTPNYYLRQWHALHSESYCQAAYDRESPPPALSRCDSCSKETKDLYRCLFCLGLWSHCSSCLVASHQFQHTHRPQVWNGTYWTNVSLADLGLVLSLGHRGAPCELNEKTSTILVGELDGYTSIRV